MGIWRETSAAATCFPSLISQEGIAAHHNPSARTPITTPVVITVATADTTPAAIQQQQLASDCNPASQTCLPPNAVLASKGQKRRARIRIIIPSQTTPTRITTCSVVTLR